MCWVKMDFSQKYLLASSEEKFKFLTFKTRTFYEYKNQQT